MWTTNYQHDAAERNAAHSPAMKKKRISIYIGEYYASNSPVVIHTLLDPAWRFACLILSIESGA